MATRTPKYHLYAASRGNVFMSELATLVAAALRDVGREVVMQPGGIPQPGDGRVNIVVAPHEFSHFAIVAGHAAEQVQQALGSAVCIATEQPGTQWFDIGAEACADAPLVLDINRIGASELAARGFPARHLQLGYHECLDALGASTAAPHDARVRPRDVAVLAAKTDRRTEFVASAAPMLWARECDVRLFTFEQPIGPATPGFLSGKEKLQYLADTKVLLNVHRSDIAYFEWLRVIEAIANGCVVATESSLGHQPLVPFTHFVQAPLTVLTEYTTALLADDAWRNEIAQAAYEFCRTELHMTNIVGKLLGEIDESVSGARRHAPTVRRSSPIDVGPIAERTAASKDRKRPVVDPRLLRSFRSEAKTLIVSQRVALRDIEKMQVALAHGTDDHVETEMSPGFTGFTPQVSVVLTNYNYADLVVTAMASVRTTSGVQLELIVVDDHSLDDSVAVIRKVMEDHPWFPTRLVKRMVNRGLSEARNIGFQRARGEYVFVLDADNLVYPSGIGKLLREIEGEDESCAFAYGVIDCFNDLMEPVDLVSCLQWDAFRLTRSNYIDAMALVRKKAWEDVGGYDGSMDEHFGGWEDFDLWLRFASRGYSARFVSSPIARYRIHGTSMLHFFNWAPEGAIRELRARYANLPWPPQEAPLEVGE